MPTNIDGIIARIAWQTSAAVIYYIGTRTIAEINLLTPVAGWSVVAGSAGTPAAVGSDLLAIGDVAEYSGTAWKKIISNVGGFPPNGTRAVIAWPLAATLYSPLVDGTDEGKVAQWYGASLTPSLSDAEDGWTLLCEGAQTNPPTAFNENKQFSFSGTVPNGSWIQTGGPIPYGTAVVAVGAANAAGTSADLARVDHVHLGTLATVLTAGNTTGANNIAVNTGQRIQGAAELTLIALAGVMDLDSTGALSLNSSTAPINIGNDAVAQAINIGTGAAARTVTVGNSTGATSVVVDVGTGNLSLGTTATAHAVQIGSATGASSVLVNTGTGGISIGTNAVAATITIGNSTGATAAAINVGTGALDLGTNAVAHTVNIGSATGASVLNANLGTGGMNLGTNAVAGTITIGNATGATSVVVNVGTGNLDLGITATAHAVRIGSATGASSVTINTGTGGVGVGTNAIAATVTVGNVTGASAVVLNSGTGGVDINATGAGGVTIDAGATGGVSIDGSAASNVSTTAADLTLSTITSGVLSVTSAGALTQSAAGAVTINSTGSTIGIGDGANAFAINIGTGAAARTVTLGNVTGATALVLNTGTGGVDVNATGAGGVTIDTGATGAFSIDGSAASNVSVTGANLTLSTITSGDVLVTAAGAGQVVNLSGERVQANSLPIPVVLSVVSVDLKTVGTTNLYTVPASRTAIITDCVVKPTTATAAVGDTVMGIGVAPGEDDIFASQTLTGLNLTTERFKFLSSGVSVTAAAAAVIKAGVDTADTGTALVADVYLIGYLI